MTRGRRRSPLDLTSRQIQNLMAYTGVAVLVFMVVTRFPLDPIYAGLVSALLFGQRLIPWGGDRRDDPPDPTAPQDVGVAHKPTGKGERSRGDDPDVASHLRDVRRWARG